MVKLDRKAESYETIEGALREDPNNSYTHANYGWGLLEKGDHKKALEHFKESLSNDPNSRFAQAGMLEAIKASNPVYRLFLKYSFWIGNMSEKYQWAVIIGFYFGFRLLNGLAKSNPSFAPFLTPVLIVLAIIAFSTWVITPISNLFLRFNKYGKLLLDKKQKLSSNLVAISFSIFIIGLLLYFVLGQSIMITITAFGFAMMVPLGTMFAETRYKNALIYYTIAMAVVGLTGIYMAFTNNPNYGTFSNIFIFGFIGYQWIANFLMIREDNR